VIAHGPRVGDLGTIVEGQVVPGVIEEATPSSCRT